MPLTLRPIRPGGVGVFRYHARDKGYLGTLLVKIRAAGPRTWEWDVPPPGSEDLAEEIHRAVDALTVVEGALAAPVALMHNPEGSPSRKWSVFLLGAPVGMLSDTGEWVSGPFLDPPFNDALCATVKDLFACSTSSPSAPTSSSP